MTKRKTKLKLVPDVTKHQTKDAKRLLREIAKRDDIKSVVVVVLEKNGGVNFNRSLCHVSDVCLAKGMIDKWISEHFKV